MVDAAIIRAEIQELDVEFEHVCGLIRTQEKNRRHLELQAADAGGEKYLGLPEKNRLDSIRDELPNLYAWRDENRQKLMEKRSELIKAEEIEDLKQRLDEALAQRQPETAWTVASRLRILDPSSSESIDAELVRVHYQIAIDPGLNPPERLRAWEEVERICQALGHDEGLRGAREQLAMSYEQSARHKVDQEKLSSAAIDYLHALEKYGYNRARDDQQRMLGELIHLYEHLKYFPEALRYSGERIQLLQQMDRSREAYSCYSHALTICMALPEESRLDWQRKLTELTLD